HCRTLSSSANSGASVAGTCGDFVAASSAASSADSSADSVFAETFAGAGLDACWEGEVAVGGVATTIGFALSALADTPATTTNQYNSLDIFNPCGLRETVLTTYDSKDFSAPEHHAGKSALRSNARTGSGAPVRCQ